MTRDGFGRLLTSTDSRTGVSTMGSYTDGGSLLAVTDPGNRTTSFGYDVMGRRTRVDGPDALSSTGGTLANITRSSYYPHGKVKATWGDKFIGTDKL